MQLWLFFDVSSPSLFIIYLTTIFIVGNKRYSVVLILDLFLMTMKVAIIGQGVIGTTCAYTILKRFPGASVVLFGDRPFEKTCSVGPAGLFRLDKFENRKWAKASFDFFAEVEKTYPADETGVKLVSGHIQSDSKENLEGQERNYGDIVYNFRWLTEREIKALFPEPSK